MTIYFDNSATTALTHDLIDFLSNSYREYYANPSSLHSLGRKSKKAINKARKYFAKEINAEANEIKFLSGATEANNTVFKISDYDHIITSPSEHASIIEPAKAAHKSISWLNLDNEGFIDLTELESILKGQQELGKKVLVSIMHANSEIGTIQNLEAIGKLCKQYGAIFHSDCVQSLSKIPIDVKKFNLDFISCSAHKLHGPKGIGFLYISERIQEQIQDQALIIGGGQEENLRSGTENLHSILAFAEALKISSKSENIKKIRELQKYTLERLESLPGIVINGPKDLSKRLVTNINFAATNLNFTSEQLVLQLDLRGICISSGSACSYNKGNPALIESSYVLRACKIPEQIAQKSVRLSVSWTNSKNEVDKFIEILENLV